MHAKFTMDNVLISREKGTSKMLEISYWIFVTPLVILLDSGACNTVYF